MKRKKFQSRVYYSEESFLPKQELVKFVAYKLTLQELLKGCLSKENWYDLKSTQLAKGNHHTPFNFASIKTNMIDLSSPF